MSKILEGLNPEQAQAVTYKQGPLLTIAGAGTGKTTVITRRIAWLIEQGLAKTDEILALTFTDKAANSMQEKVDILVPYGYLDIWISTFHGFGDRLLRDNALELGLSPDFKVLSRPEAAVFFREHLFEFDLSYYRPLSDPTRFIEALLDIFSRAKDEDISAQEYLRYADSLAKKTKENPDDEAIGEEAVKAREVACCYIKFQELLLREGKVDFGNQVYLALELLRKHPSVLKRYQEQFKYILVDEFQDTNFTQFQLVKLLAAKNKNITCVADDDQCIYRWRGAAYSNILNFIKEYPDAQKIALIQNYRSTPVILDSAYRLIQHNNPERFEVKSNINKNLKSQFNGGEDIKHLHFDTQSNEADNVAKVIQDKVKNGRYKYSDFAILVRANNDADPFLRSLNMSGIPWRFSGNQGLYSQEEVRIAIAFLRIMGNIQDSLSLYYLATSEIYGLTPLDLGPAMHFSKRRNASLFFVLENLDSNVDISGLISDTAKEKIKNVISDIKKFLGFSRNLTSGRLLYQFLNDSGFLKRLVQEPPQAINEERLLNLAKFFDLVHNFETIAREDRVIYFVNYLNLLIEAGDDPATAEADMDIEAVNVLTIHKAKGLEFEVVFMVSLVGGRFPWPRRHRPIELPDELIKDILPSGDFHLQEERRLFYVGMTRAKKELYFTSAFDYGGSRMRKVSQFVFEALGITLEKIKIMKSSGIEAIKRHAPRANIELSPKGPKDEDEIISLSYYQIDDYLTCPLKYKYVHILRVPIMEHHSVLYGKALHDAVQKYFRYKMKGLSQGADDLINVFIEAFKQEGFLNREHQKERLDVGIEALKRFFIQQEALKEIPTYIEKDFSFTLSATRIVGRWDRLDIDENESRIIDFKSSGVTKQKDADKKAKESLQLAIYAVAFKHIFKKLPDFAELHFLESGLIARHKVTKEDLERAVESMQEAAQGIRKYNFLARPAYLACTYCAYSQICPSSAARPS